MELVENSNDVLYKIWMFAQTNRLVLASPRSSAELALDEQIRFFALLESSLSHARELMHFLYFKPAKNYIRAVDYTPDRAALPARWAGFTKDLKQLNENLVHLTYVRAPDVVSWDFAGDLTAGLLTFVNAVPPELVQPNFRTIAGHTLLDQSSLASLRVMPSDRSASAARGHRVNELFAD